MVDMTGEYMRLMAILQDHGFLRYSADGFLSERDMGELGSRLDELDGLMEKRELIDWFANGADGIRILKDTAHNLDRIVDKTMEDTVTADDRSKLAGMASSLRRLADQLESITG
ncbi:hypothetical protein BAAM0483_05255 [Bifidobacterium animalis subsp. animalis MCC 0483]|uniref:Uncharacterized protein n=1 Tax=Bifidobacterium animalis subsp. animalis MCC 0483 TaxID=1365955 RepID=A0AB34T8Q4_9BIFI|nr:hypothetical protein [Bifidobacterium animalis]KOA49553.1 hypothetical protein BAAM0483_05255 [Bifidobacterium animalis subsp. animalis MCC 0483]